MTYNMGFFAVALPGDKVSVLNYKRKPARWEPGLVRVVTATTLHSDDNSLHVHYEVTVTGRSGKTYSITVGERDITV